MIGLHHLNCIRADCRDDAETRPTGPIMTTSSVPDKSAATPDMPSSPVDDPRDDRRTAVVVVHGMGQQRPLDMLKKFVCTALEPLAGKWDYYYSRPTEITDSYEARRYIARKINGSNGTLEQGTTEIFEYHWSYLMTGNKFGDLFPSTFRLMVRRPRNVPAQLLGAWRLVWLLLLLIAAAAAAWFVWRSHIPTRVAAILGSAAVLAVVGVAWRALSSVIVGSFVDVVRYLDTSPRSYEARRKVRGGMVDLLRRLHDDEDYARIVVVAHSLGGFIAYDGMTSLWDEMHGKHAGSQPPTGSNQVPLRNLKPLEWSADLLLKLPLPRGVSPELAETAVVDQLRPDRVEPTTPRGRFRHRQFVLWQGLRAQGNPWRITDLVTVGTPMSFAHLLVTRAKLFNGLRKQSAALGLFEDKIQRGELMRCPPRSESLPAEVVGETTPVRYSSSRTDPVQVLGSQSMFAVTRWTNLFFPVDPGALAGDWFGGPLGHLWGDGIEDIAVLGNRKTRRAWVVPHIRYFNCPSVDEGDSIAHYVREALDLKLDPSALPNVPETANSPTFQ
jgi:hypothetical protein